MIKYSCGTFERGLAFMSFWLTPIALILPPILFILPAIIYRFLVSKKTMQNKKAAIISLVYTISAIALILILSNGWALDQCLFFAILGFVNHYVLAGIKENKKGQIVLFRILWAFPSIIVHSIVNSFTFPVIIDPLALPSEEMTATVIYFASFIIVIVFYISRFKKVKENVEAKFRWREKLMQEAEEREKQEQNID